ncbi:MAG TPA: DNA polymerase III subunit gamma/tau [candidate division Zixibacteria bacterium]|nr:DNA polymerase III subunit gamma/tau [candidate division Zixibacteria bacterium]
MSQALYRKWRPARFDQVVGQEHVTSTLKNAVVAGRLGHAYLFSGPRGTGKTTIARLVAKAANCHDSDLTQRPCNVCPPCIAVNEGRYLDLIEIDAASNTGVDDIRDLREKINFAPSEGRIKVYIIDEVHMLSTAAFNALLKTLEEPPDHAMFILATTEEHKVLLTIKSRCQLFNFRLLTSQEITGRLRWLAEQENLTLEEPAVAMISQHAAGSMRDAESLLDQLVAAPGDTITLERAQTVLGTASIEAISTLADALLAGDGPGGLSIIHETLASGADARQFSRQMLSHMRHLLLVSMAGHELPLGLTEDQAATMNRQASGADRSFLIDAVKRFNSAAHIPTGSWQPQLPLELAFIELLPMSNDSRSAEKSVRAQGVQQKKAKKIQPLPVVEPQNNPEPTATNPEETKSTIKATVSPSSAPSIDDVKSLWPELRERVAKKDSNLPALLASSKPLATEGATLILGFDYPILMDKFEKRKEAKDIVAAELSELLHVHVTVRTIVTEHYIPPAIEEGINIEEFSALAQELGGVVHDQ